MQSIVAIVYIWFQDAVPCDHGSFTTVAVFQAQELREEAQLELKVAWKGREKPWFSLQSCRKTNENIIEYLYKHSLCS